MGTGWLRRLRAALGLAWFMLFATLLSAAALPHFVRMAGGDAFVIRGGSMEPAIPLGSLIVVSEIEPIAANVGDVITVRADNGVVYSHRISEVVGDGDERRFRLRGDANDAPDGRLVPARALLGRVDAHLPFAGYLVALLALPSGVMSVMSMFGSLLLAYWLLEDIDADPGARELQPRPA
jgi:signal peptidase